MIDTVHDSTLTALSSTTSTRLLFLGKLNFGNCGFVDSAIGICVLEGWRVSIALTGEATIGAVAAAPLAFAALEDATWKSGALCWVEGAGWNRGADGGIVEGGIGAAVLFVAPSEKRDALCRRGVRVAVLEEGVV